MNTDNQRRGISRGKSGARDPLGMLILGSQLGKLVLVDNVLVFAFSFSL